MKISPERRVSILIMIKHSNILPSVNDRDIKTPIELFQEQLRIKTKQYGHFRFEDDIWFCEKVKNKINYKSQITVNFSTVPVPYKKLAKYFALLLTNNISTIKNKVFFISKFFNYFETFFQNTLLKDIDVKTISRYEMFISENETRIQSRMIYTAIQQFFNLLKGFPGMPVNNPTKKLNPFNEKTFKNKGKYIPPFVIKQLDNLMKDEDNGIPLVFRLCYWLQRSFPNRITEVCNIKTDALKALYSSHILSIPTTKQNSGYLLEEYKSIPILYTGHGRYIVELFNRWLIERNQLIKELPYKEELQNILLIFPIFSFKSMGNNSLQISSTSLRYLKVMKLRIEKPDITINELYQKLLNEGDVIDRNTIRNYIKNKLNETSIELKAFTGSRFNKYLQQIITFFNIKDENGDIYLASSHQFRHNATTDRLYIGGYTFDQIRVLRNDKGENMTLHYAHQIKEMHKEAWLSSTGLNSPSDAPVEFKGIILNLDDKRVLNRLLKNPGAYLTWEANNKKGVGICSNIHGCNPNGTDIHFECYECNWFVPKVEYLEDYKRELVYWTDIMKNAVGKSNRVAHFENAIRNMNCLERIIEICEHGLKKVGEIIELQ